MVALLVSVLHALSLPAAFALFRWCAPARPAGEYTAEELDAFSKRYAWLNWLAIGLLIVCMPICGAIWTAALVCVEWLHDRAMPPRELLVRLRPSWLLWALPGLPLGIVTFGWLSEICLCVFCDAEFCRKLRAAGDRRMRWNSVKVFGWITVVFVSGASLWSMLALRWYTRFEQDRVVINPLVGWKESAYTYHQIKDLVEATHLVAPNGNLVERTRQFVIFDDGRKWCHDGELRDVEPLLTILKAKTGKSFRRVRFIEDA